MLRVTHAAGGRRRRLRGLSLSASLFALGACAVPPSMEVRQGVSPAYEDENVRFRTTYYFRVFDVCEGRIPLTPAVQVDGVGQGFLGEKPRGPYYYKTDSLYRFVMTGKANALASKIHFESGTLRREQIDPFGTSVRFSQTANAFVVNSPDENRILARQEDTIAQLRQLAALKKELGDQLAGAGPQIDGLIRQNLDQLSPTGRSPASDAPSPAAQANQAHANATTADRVATAAAKLKTAYDDFKTKVGDTKTALDQQAGTQASDLAGADWAAAAVTTKLKAAGNTAATLSLPGPTPSDAEDVKNARAALATLVDDIGKATLATTTTGVKLKGLAGSGAAVTGLDEARKAFDDAASLIAAARKDVTAATPLAAKADALLANGAANSTKLKSVGDDIDAAKADFDAWNTKLATLEARTAVSAIPDKSTDVDGLVKLTNGWRDAAKTASTAGQEFTDASASDRTKKADAFKKASNDTNDAAKKAQTAFTAIDPILAGATARIAPKLAGRDALAKAVGDVVDKAGGPAKSLLQALSATREEIRGAAERAGALNGVAGSQPTLPAATGLPSKGTDIVLCDNDVPARRGFQVLGPEGYRTFDQNERLLMGMSSSAKPLIGTLQALSNRMLDGRRGQTDTSGQVAAERLRVDRAAGIYDTITAIDTQATLPASDLAKRVRESFEANPAARKK